MKEASWPRRPSVVVHRPRPRTAVQRPLLHHRAGRRDAWIAYYIAVRVDPTVFPARAGLTGVHGRPEKWNYAIGFRMIFLGLLISAHPSTPLAAGEGWSGCRLLPPRTAVDLHLLRDLGGQPARSRSSTTSTSEPRRHQLHGGRVLRDSVEWALGACRAEKAELSDVLGSREPAATSGAQSRAMPVRSASMNWRPHSMWNHLDNHSRVVLFGSSPLGTTSQARRSG
jgi:hypothetical protein